MTTLDTTISNQRTLSTTSQSVEQASRLLAAKTSEDACSTTEPAANARAAILQPQLPPSARDFDVYCQAVLECLSTRLVVQQFKISQSRVCQIIKRVRAWLWKIAPAGEDLPPTERVVLMARYLAADRLEHLYHEAMHAWRASWSHVERSRHVGSGAPVINMTSQTGDPKYLTAAARIALAQARLGMPGGLVADAQAELPDEEEGSSDHAPTNMHGDGEAGSEWPEQSQLSLAPTADHPAGDCSAGSDSGSQNCASPPPAAGATDASAETSGPLLTDRRAARREFLAPIQQLVARDQREPVTRVKVSSETPGLTLEQLVSSLQRTNAAS